MNEPIIIAYTAADAVADGSSTQPFPEIAREAGYLIPVVLTRRAHTAVIEWTRSDYPQDETGRFWDVLTTGRYAAARAAAAPGSTHPFHVFAVANTTASGKPSRSELPRRVELTARLEAFDREMSPCIVIATPGED